MVKISFEVPFKKRYSNLDTATKERVITQLEKLAANPQVGKPMRYDRKGTRELYVPPFRLSYYIDAENDRIVILDLYHKKQQS